MDGFPKCFLLQFGNLVGAEGTRNFKAPCHVVGGAYLQHHSFPPLAPLEDLGTSKSGCSKLISHQRQENKHAPILSLSQAQL